MSSNPKTFISLIIFCVVMFPAGSWAIVIDKPFGNQKVVLEMIMNCSNRTGLAATQTPIPIGAGDSNVGSLSEPVYVNCFTNSGSAQNSGIDSNSPTGLNRHQIKFLSKIENSPALGASAKAGILKKFSEKVEFFGSKEVFWFGEYDRETRHEAIDLMQQARREAKEAAIQEVRKNARSSLNGAGAGLIQEIGSVARQVAQGKGKGIGQGRGKGH